MNTHRFIGFILIAMFSANAAASIVVLNITFDDYPEETGFGLWLSSAAPEVSDYLGNPALALDGLAYDVDSSSQIGNGTGYIEPGDLKGEDPGSSTFVWEVGVGQYTFILGDTVGDGICCEFGVGSFDLRVDGNLVLAGGSFADFAAVDFNATIPIPLPAPLLLLSTALIGLIGWRRR